MMFGTATTTSNELAIIINSLSILMLLGWVSYLVIKMRK